MPWKGEKDPYKIWLSEIILQQTRVEQGWNYYKNLVQAFPTIKDLAKAPQTRVFKLWEGLGYYIRCRNLIATAKMIFKEKNGIFPCKYEDILALKGVGPYTAAAISSFAFNLPYAVVDGNVFRVLSRYFGMKIPVDSTEGKKKFRLLAEELLDRENPGTYNQALMDFGAVVCKPKLPLCTSCPLKKKCKAYLKGWVTRLPVKERSVSNKFRCFFYLVVSHSGKLYVRKRTEKDIWANLYEFILIEPASALSLEELKKENDFRKIFGSCRMEIVSVSAPVSQQLTHQTIRGCFVRINIAKPLKTTAYKAIPFNRLSSLPFPKMIARYLLENREYPFER